MTQWGNVDNAANSVNYVVEAYGKKITTANVAMLYGNTTADLFQADQTVGQYGVSAAEQTAIRASANARPAHAGWVLRREGSGGRAGRVHYEVMVAMSSMSGDGSDDAVFYDYYIQIVTQPSDSSETTGNAVSFTVAANSTPTGATLSYAWYVDGGAGTFAQISDGGVYANSNTATLSISDNTGLDGNVYMCQVFTSGAANVQTSNATLSEV